MIGAVAASLRRYYPDQVHRVGNAPIALASQPPGSPSSTHMIAIRQVGQGTVIYLSPIIKDTRADVKGKTFVHIMFTRKALEWFASAVFMSNNGDDAVSQ